MTENYIKPGHTHKDPAHTGFQFLEDLSTAYWYSHVLFSALELDLFRHLEAGADTCGKLSDAADCRPEELARMLAAMKAVGLVHGREGKYWNTQAASLYLVPGKPGYMGEFFLYRRYMRPKWEGLTGAVALEPPGAEEDLSYKERNFRYVRAMDTLVRQKAGEIAAWVKAEDISGPVLDVGGGAGSLIRAVREACGPLPAVLFDISEVIEAAGRLCPEERDWEGIDRVAGDFRTHEFNRRFGLVILGNFLHAYGRKEARELLEKAVGLLAPDGLLLIHDYFPDQQGRVPQKGALYDLAMMLNTYNGACQEAKTIISWCRAAGLSACGMKPLSTDSAVILARSAGPLNLDLNPLEVFAKDLDIEAFVPISPAHVITAAWPRQKCRTGCTLYHKGLQCPPYGMDHHRTRELMDSYSRAYLVRGTPPGKAFHKVLLSLEKKAFLEGCHKAFSMGAGPCTVCPDCPPADGKCRFPHLARPSMEGSGIDVYTTAANAGVHIKPVQERGQYVTYIGLLLVE
ncbi:MAG: DUF2284 domain-containing protein [Desulfobacteraceae bacterium]|nr:DUF2284 domain-containing protein [Desulfobacteraceae bacterium]